MASDLVPPQLALERGYEPHLMSYVTLQPTDSVTPFYGPPNVVDAGVAGVAFVIAVTALLLARRLERHGVRLVMLVVSAALALILG
jgi:nitrate reductase gamma subunit